MRRRDRIVGIVTARMSSTRLPGKTLLPLAGKPVLEHVIESVRAAGVVDEIVVATSRNPANEPIVALAERCDVGCYQGEEEDVLERFIQVLRRWDYPHCVRLCADNPITDMETTARLVEAHLSGDFDYTCVRGLHLPLGLTEAVSRRVLEVEDGEVGMDFRRESITIFIREQADRFRIKALAPDPFLNQTALRLTLDYPEDYTMLSTVFDRLYDGRPIDYRRALEFMRDHPEVAAINAQQEQKAGNVYWQELDERLPRD
ncbi:MAG TPA: NTP transferase domain-containing protein [Candidatus Krumholzibacteria bacterium]|nr:NTP transferase domain-containing protein [Candidatus Krumholzibacteria bacterium]